VAERLAPQNDAGLPIAIRATDAFLIGCSLLAIVFAVRGFAELAAGSAFYLAAPPLENGQALRVRSLMAFAGGAIHLAAAGFLWRHARSLAAKLSA
jgi:hypothetical protein